MTAVVLHLSDIHIKNKTDPVLKRGEKIAACAFEVLPEASAVFILVSGDIAFSGEHEQYEFAIEFFNGLRDVIEREKKIPVHYIVCPGNHDCFFDLANKSRALLLDALSRDPSQAVDESVVETCCAVQAPYFEFERIINSDYANASGDKLWQTLFYSVEGKEIAFDCINVSWMSRKREEMGSLAFPFDRYVREQKDGTDLRIGVLHHPLHWLSQRIYQPFRKALRQREHIVFSGHEHIGNFGENIDSESGHSAYVEGCVLQGEKEFSRSEFNVIVFDLGEGTYRCSKYMWSTDHYETSEEGSWEDYRNIPVRARNPFEIQPAFKALTVDPGASFKRLGADEIVLSDVYVYPDC